MAVSLAAKWSRWLHGAAGKGQKGKPAGSASATTFRLFRSPLAWGDKISPFLPTHPTSRPSPPLLVTTSLGILHLRPLGVGIWDFPNKKETQWCVSASAPYLSGPSLSPSLITPASGSSRCSPRDVRLRGPYRRHRAIASSLRSLPLQQVT